MPEKIREKPETPETSDPMDLPTVSISDLPAVFESVMKQLDQISKRPSIVLARQSEKKQLDQISKKPARAIPDEVSPIPPERPEVGLLRALYEVLVDMAKVLAESGRQTADMAAVTKANLTALPAVVGELRESRQASARSDRRIVWLTVALVAATVMGAIAVLPGFVQEITAAWSWVQSLR